MEKTYEEIGADMVRDLPAELLTWAQGQAAVRGQSLSEFNADALLSYRALIGQGLTFIAPEAAYE